MGFIIAIISTIVALISAVPIIVVAIKAVRHRKNMTKQLMESVYRTSVICFSIIFIFSFIAKVFYNVEPKTDLNSIFLLFRDVLLDLLIEFWAVPVGIYLFKKQLKKYGD